MFGSKKEIVFIGAQIHYTHDRDLFQKIGVWIGSMILVMLSSAILDPIARPIENFLVSNGMEWFWVVIMWAYIIGAYIFFVKFLTQYIIPPWRTTLKYVKSFGVTLSKYEAEKISFLTDGSLGDQWYPLERLKDIDDKDKRTQLFEFANRIAEKHGIRRPF